MASVLTVNVNEVKQLAQKLNGFALTDAQTGNLLHSLGMEVAEQTKDRFDSNLGPDGHAWKPWTEAYHKYLKRKFPKASLLVREGNMSKITFQVNGSASVLVGSPAEYADYHQNAKKESRRRRFLGLSTGDINELQEMIDLFMEKGAG
jgi:phage virion morphogenesis protein